MKNKTGEFNHYKGFQNMDYNRLPHITHRYQPFYDENSDFNTNAKSYYDYLARFNASFKAIIDHINSATDRNLETLETKTVELIKEGDWVWNGEGDNGYDEIVKLLANVKVSQEEFTKRYLDEVIPVANTLKVMDSGLYAPDYELILDKIENKLKDFDERIEEISKNVDSYLGHGMTRLKKGIDYEIEWFNGFYSETTDLIVMGAERMNQLDLHILTDSGTGDILKNDKIVTNAEMSHSPYENVPQKSIIFRLALKGKYADYYSSDIVNNRSKPSLWNIAPSSNRASWDATIATHILGGVLRFSWRSYADGYNKTLNLYNAPDMYLDYGNLDLLITLQKVGG